MEPLSPTRVGLNLYNKGLKLTHYLTDYTLFLLLAFKTTAFATYIDLIIASYLVEPSDSNQRRWTIPVQLQPRVKTECTWYTGWSALPPSSMNALDYTVLQNSCFQFRKRDRINAPCISLK